jgi:putative DNA primase/helicase
MPRERCKRSEAMAERRIFDVSNLATTEPNNKIYVDAAEEYFNDLIEANSVSVSFADFIKPWLRDRSIENAAIDYASRGWHVFPAPLGTKKSHKKKEHSDGRPWGATIDVAEIKRDFMEWPDANVGIVCGAGSGIFVVEADTQEGHDVDGIASLVTLQVDNGELPPTLQAVSPSGSVHYYFRHPGAAFNIKNSAGAIAAGVDCRGDGGMVIGVPSAKPGKGVYRWLNDLPIADAPAWLLNLVVTKDVPKEVPSITAQAQALVKQPDGKLDPYLKHAADNPEGRGYIEAVLSGEYDAVAQLSKGRNHRLNIAACKLGHYVAGGILDEQVAIDRLMEACEANGLIGHTGRTQCLATIASGLAKGKLEPKGIPERLPEVLKQGTAVEIVQATQLIDNGTVTQDGIARIFAHRYNGRLRYCHDTGAWFGWTGSHWRQDHKNMAFQFARELGREFTDMASTIKSDLKEVRRVTFAGGVERFAQSDPVFAVTNDDWDQDPYLLGTPDGTVDLRTGILREADSSDGITKTTLVAPSDSSDCPLWLKFLIETFGDDPAMLRFLQQWAGYCLTGDTREQALFFGTGDGGNGKGVWLHTRMAIMKDYAVAAAMSTFTASAQERHSTELAMLRGARLVTASETEQGRAWAEARIKQMTGGDPITCRLMRQDNFTYLPQFKLDIIGNHKPQLRNVDAAARRRFNIVPFDRKPVVVDRELEQKLLTEAPAILRWMIDGCLDWQKHGLVRPQIVLDATESYFEDQDSLGQWIDECTDCEPGNTHKSATSAELYKSWSEYSHAAGENPGSQKEFVNMLLAAGKGIIAHRLNKGVIYKCIRLVPMTSYQETTEERSTGEASLFPPGS